MEQVPCQPETYELLSFVSEAPTYQDDLQKIEDNKFFCFGILPPTVDIGTIIKHREHDEVLYDV
jgi:hypothetical protein